LLRRFAIARTCRACSFTPRLLFGRIQSLATKTSQQASASLRFANAQVTALAAHMEERPKAAAR